jgi:phosphatidylserine/phosphatidylglycerophosphate/cardiolipin synthase-like enzyme
MNDYTNSVVNKSLTLKLWRGERMCLMGMDVANPEADFVGFSIEVKRPGANDFMVLRNRLAFSYPAAGPSGSGDKQFSSLQAPFQAFRWVHFPQQPQPGIYTYRVTKQHMKVDGTCTPGDSATATISLDDQLYSGFLNVGFTRGYASSQAFNEQFNPKGDAPPLIFPKEGGGGEFGPGFDKSKAPAGVYPWLGFEAYELIFGILHEVATDPSLTLDAFVYDLDEPDIIAGFASIGNRLRIILDDSGTHEAKTSGPSQGEKTFVASAGRKNVKRMHFNNLQHNKVLIVKRNGKPAKVLCGSTNFSFNGIYLQANNALVFEGPDVAGLFEQYFEQAFQLPKAFAKDPLAAKWQLIQAVGAPPVQFCLSPHSDPTLSLGPVAAAIDQATSSVFFAIAFLYQTSKKGLVRAAVDRLTNKPLFSYGISDKGSSLQVKKPDGSDGIVPFAYLKKNTSPPFSAEWGGAGIHEHNKFVVTDFNLPTAKVFTGSCNLSESGEKGNGDHLIMIQDPRVATSYAIQAVLIFDHLHFASKMNAVKKKTNLVLQKPLKFSKKAKETWFARFYKQDSELVHDRNLFSH